MSFGGPIAAIWLVLKEQAERRKKLDITSRLMKLNEVQKNHEMIMQICHEKGLSVPPKVEHDYNLTLNLKKELTGELAALNTSHKSMTSHESASP